jgi:exodeoxyribonuclease V alpha subunit
MSIELDALCSQKFFTELDRRFALFIAELSDDKSPELMLTSLLVSTMTGRGHICVEIPAIAGSHLPDVIGEGDEISPSVCDVLLPSHQPWIDILRRSAVVGCPYEYKPLILDERGRLYLYRYWEYERQLAENITQRLSGKPDAIDLPLLEEGLNRLFPPGGEEGVDWQRVAALTAVIFNYCVISGGPGTGKTSTVIKILALLVEQAQSAGHNLHIALAAPTGKAAARLAESVREMRELLDCSDVIREAIPSESFTIHRLLGTVHGSPYFRHNIDNPLPHDVVVVDESSMADLALMLKLFQAVPMRSRLILLGDKDQLSSVEAGAVLGDICDTGNQHGYSESFRITIKDIGNELIPEENEREEPPIADSIVVLRRSYRFGSTSGIGLVSSLIKSGDAEGAIGLLKEGRFEDIVINTVPTHHIFDSIGEHIKIGYAPYLMAQSPDESFRNFSRFTILCALRQGPFGVQNINYLSERVLARAGLIRIEGDWYKGRPIMITRNNYELRLFNGDVGLMLQDDSDDMLATFFSSADGTLKRVLPLKLPEHETAFSMTVHKSQGSEFDHVLLLLPDRPSRVLTRELVYTAITRARRRVEIWGREDILRFAINNPTRRRSGLRDILWE